MSVRYFTEKVSLPYLFAYLVSSSSKAVLNTLTLDSLIKLFTYYLFIYFVKIKNIRVLPRNNFLNLKMVFSFTKALPVAR